LREIKFVKNKNYKNITKILQVYEIFVMKYKIIDFNVVMSYNIKE